MSSYFIVIADAIDFHAPVKLGHIIHLTGRVTFTSKKSMEIEVVVDAKDYLAGMVSLFILKNKQYLPLSIKPFKINIQIFCSSWVSFEQPSPAIFEHHKES